MNNAALEINDNDSQIRSYLMPELVVFFGESSSDIIRDIDTVLDNKNLSNENLGLFKQLAYDSQSAFTDLKVTPPYRAAVTAYGEAELSKKLVQMRKMIQSQPGIPFVHEGTGMFYGMGEASGKLAYMFPGQGAQYLGMGGALAKAFPEAARVWEKLGGMRFAGESIKEVVFPPKASSQKAMKGAFLKLSGADWTNPSISVAGEAIFKLLENMGVRPDAVAGHSFGDVSTYRAAGIISDEDMIRATRYRGELGVSCPLATRGCILIVSETADRIREVFQEYGIEEAWIANYNTPEQTVLSGVKDAILKAHETFEKEGIQSLLIPISAAPHCPLAVDVADNFVEYLQDVDFKPAECDLYSFVFGRRVKKNDPDLFRKILGTHTAKSVRFMQQIESMHKEGVRIFVEVAPSDILTGLVRQILDGKPHIAIHTDKSKSDPILNFLNAVAVLFKEGKVKDFMTLWEGYALPHSTAYDQAPPPDEAKVKHLKMLDLEFAKMERETSA